MESDAAQIFFSAEWKYNQNFDYLCIQARLTVDYFIEQLAWVEIYQVIKIMFLEANVVNVTVAYDVSSEHSKQLSLLQTFIDSKNFNGAFEEMDSLYWLTNKKPLSMKKRALLNCLKTARLKKPLISEAKSQKLLPMLKYILLAIDNFPILSSQQLFDMIVVVFFSFCYEIDLQG